MSSVGVESSEQLRPLRPGSPEAQRVYDALFPCYVEVSAVTQYRKKGSKPGGWGGHATMFLSGAEIERGAGFPRLRLTAPGNDPSASESGTGVSVNRIFRNLAWVAIPGRDEFFRGGLASNEVLDQDFYEAAVQRAVQAGWFAGIAVADDLMRQKPIAMPAQEFIVRNAIGTDFALTFARTTYTARLPLSRDSMGTVIAYLNGVNETARQTGYIWNAFTNNCSHLLHNAVAAAGVWDPKEPRGPGTIDLMKDVLSLSKALLRRRMSDFSFPANSFVRLYEAGNERPIDDARAAFGNHDIVRTMNDGWMSTGPGALIASYRMHDPSLNRLFASGRDPLLFSVPILWDKKKEFEQLTRDPPASLTDLGANLVSFRERYARTMATRERLKEEAVPPGNEEDGHAFHLFAERFYERISSELEMTEARIAEYERIVGSA